MHLVRLEWCTMVRFLNALLVRHRLLPTHSYSLNSHLYLERSFAKSLCLIWAQGIHRKESIYRMTWVLKGDEGRLGGSVCVASDS